MLLYALVRRKYPECFEILESGPVYKNEYANDPIPGSNFSIHEFLSYDRRMLNLIGEYKTPGNFYNVMKDLQEVKELDGFKEVFENLQTRYSETIIKGMEAEIYDAMINKDPKSEKKMKENFDSLSDEFHKFLANEDPEREKIFDALHIAYVRMDSELYPVK